MVSAEIAQNQKWHLFFEKGVFWHGWKVGFTNCVLESCVFWNTIFIVFSAKHSFSKTKTVCWKKQKIYENIGLFLNMAKWCFGGLSFEVLMLLWFVFGVSGIVPEVLEMRVFQFWGLLWGGLFLFILGLEGLGVFVFLVLFLFFVLLFFLFCLICFVLLLDCFWCWFLFCFCFSCFFLVFFVFWRF